jgi:hypothetical protein
MVASATRGCLGWYLPVPGLGREGLESAQLLGRSTNAEYCPTADLVTEFKIEWNRGRADHQVSGIRRQLR